MSYLLRLFENAAEEVTIPNPLNLSDVVSINGVGVSGTPVSGAQTFTGAVAISDATDTSSATTGCLKLAGGLGIVKALWVGSTIKAAGCVSPTTTDGAALGSTSLMWSDLFLASGAVINFNNGNVTITHASTLLTIAGGGLALGATGSAITCTAGTPVMGVYSTSSSTSGSTSVSPFLMESTMTGAGGVGGRAKFYMTTNVALGGWSNALKAEVLYGASGSTTGLGSSLCVEMTLSAGTSTGTYAPIEVELNLGSGALTGTLTSLIYFSINGADAGTFDDNGVLFDLVGVTSGSAHIWYDHQGTAPTNVEEWIRVKTPGGLRYLPLYNAVV